MNLTSPIEMCSQSTTETWKRVLAGDVEAYEAVVASHQSAVSAVAYGIVGDFPISQDIAQETFWVAWRKRDTLRDSVRLKGWLCGIARNLARNWQKSNKRPVASVNQCGEQLVEGSSSEDPVVKSMAKEEQALVWSALEELSESYREVLTLYYREGKSIAEVSAALEINVDAARQRLNRGRIMLKGRVAQLVEGVLVNSAPDKSFTVKVIAGLVSAGAVTNSGTATASGVAAAQTSGVSGVATATVSKIAAGTSMGMMGGLVGTVGGLGGAFLGIWLPAQFAPTETERQLMMRRGRVMMGFCLAYTAAFLAITSVFVITPFNPLIFFALCLGITVPFMAAVIVCSLRLRSQCDELRGRVRPQEDPNQSWMSKTSLSSPHSARKYRGRRWTSRVRLFGFPLLDIQFADIEPGLPKNGKKVRRHAKGWIAVGDIATGVIAIGFVARGIVAVGSLSIGLFSIGGVALGLMSVGGLAAGAFAVGGGAIGWNASGGAAIGVHAAAGGAAAAWHVAAGGGAFAHDLAFGGFAVAEESNTPVAKRVAEAETMLAELMWLSKHKWILFFITAGAIVLQIIVARRLYTVVVE